MRPEAAAKKEKSKLTVGHYVFFDVLAAVFSVAPGALAWSAVVYGLVQLHGSMLFFPALLVAPLAVALVFICMLRLFRMMMPALKPGVTRIGLNKGTMAWYCHLALNRALKVSGMRYLLNV